MFISYSSRDAGLAAELNDALGRASFATWFAPRDVEPGASFAEGIEAGIRDAALREAAIDWRIADPDGDLSAEVERVENIFRSEIGQWGQVVVKAAPPASPAAPRSQTGGADSPEGAPRDA